MRIKKKYGIKPETLLDLLFPRRCPVCDKPVPFGDMVCPECSGHPKRIKEPFCLKCGRPAAEEEEYCSACREKEHSFDCGRSLFFYPTVVTAMYRMKNDGRQEYADYFSAELAKGLGRWILSIRPQVLIPVPMHPEKQKKRGYNQAELIARGLGKRLGFDIDAALVTRASATAAAKRMGEQERAAALKKAFKITRNSVKWTKVLIVDDIFTTGATVDAVASVLREKGVKEISFVCAAAAGGPGNHL